VDGHLVIEGGETIGRLLQATTRAPRRAALLCDVDGTISPIAATPGSAIVPAATRELLARLASRLGLVAIITGRAVADARRMADVPGAAYVGAHGLETMAAGSEPVIAEQARPFLALIEETAAQARRELDHERLGIVLEQKPAGFAAHYRLAPDKDAARREILERVVTPARARGLAVMTGHFVVEVRPPVPLTKGTATRGLLEAGDYLSATVCGDDLTDVAAFDAAHAWAQCDERRLACAVAAITAETPQPVKAAADAQVEATPGITMLLTAMLAAAGG
jgi:trehalose 6-phosphate phosphatase